MPSAWRFARGCSSIAVNASGRVRPTRPLAFRAVTFVVARGTHERDFVGSFRNERSIRASRRLHRERPSGPCDPANTGSPHNEIPGPGRHLANRQIGNGRVSVELSAHQIRPLGGPAEPLAERSTDVAAEQRVGAVDQHVGNAGAHLRTVGVAQCIDRAELHQRLVTRLPNHVENERVRHHHRIRLHRPVVVRVGRLANSAGQRIRAEPFSLRVRDPVERLGLHRIVFARARIAEHLHPRARVTRVEARPLPCAQKLASALAMPLADIQRERVDPRVDARKRDLCDRLARLGDLGIGRRNGSARGTFAGG